MSNSLNQSSSNISSNNNNNNVDSISQQELLLAKLNNNNNTQFGSGENIELSKDQQEHNNNKLRAGRRSPKLTRSNQGQVRKSPELSNKNSKLRYSGSEQHLQLSSNTLIRVPEISKLTGGKKAQSSKQLDHPYIHYTSVNQLSRSPLGSMMNGGDHGSGDHNQLSKSASTIINLATSERQHKLARDEKLQHKSQALQQQQQHQQIDRSDSTSLPSSTTSTSESMFRRGLRLVLFYILLYLN